MTNLRRIRSQCDRMQQVLIHFSVLRLTVLHSVLDLLQQFEPCLYQVHSADYSSDAIGFKNQILSTIDASIALLCESVNTEDPAVVTLKKI